MSTVINTNIDAIIAERNLSALSTQYSQSVEKLSSGLRINRAADDAAGLAISQNLQAQVNGLNQAQSNAQDGISMVQTAEGALNEVQAMLQRMNELAVEAANGTLGSSDLKSVATEMEALTNEIDRISQSTTFNGLGLLDGNLSTQLDTTSGINAGFVISGTTNTSVQSVDVSNAKAGTTYTLSDNTGKLTLSDTSGNSQTIDLSGVTLSANGSYVLDFGSLGVQLTVASVAGETGANVATALDTKTIVTAAGNQSATLQIGAAQGDTLAVKFQQVNSTTLGISGNANYTGFTSGTPTNTDANALISVFQSAIDQISTIRGNLGATQNRLQHTVNSLSVASENLTASESRIQDLDVASEMVNFTKLQILQQAGTAVLAQANQSPSYVLKLLQ